MKKRHLIVAILIVLLLLGTLVYGTAIAESVKISETGVPWAEWSVERKTYVLVVPAIVANNSNETVEIALRMRAVDGQGKAVLSDSGNVILQPGQTKGWSSRTDVSEETISLLSDASIDIMSITPLKSQTKSREIAAKVSIADLNTSPYKVTYILNDQTKQPFSGKDIKITLMYRDAEGILVYVQTVTPEQNSSSDGSLQASCSLDREFSSLLISRGVRTVSAVAYCEEETTTKPPTPTPSSKSEKLSIKWNAAQYKWDLYLNDIKLPSDPDILKIEMDSIFGHQNNVTSAGNRWYWYPDKTIQLSFNDLQFEQIGVQKDGSAWLDVRMTFNDPAQAQKYLNSLHNSLKTHYYNTNIWQDDKWSYSSYNANNSNDLQMLFNRKEDFLFGYTYYGSVDYWDSHITVQYWKLDSFDLVMVRFPLISGAAATPTPTSTQPPTPTPTPKSEEFSIKWNTAQYKWDLYLNDRKLSSDPDVLKTEMDSVFGKQNNTNNSSWWWNVGYNTQLLFMDKQFESAYVQKSGYQCFYLRKNFKDVSKAQEYITAFAKALKVHYYDTNIWKDDKWIYSVLSPYNSNDMQKLLNGKEDFLFEYIYNGSEKYWNSRFSIRYLKYDSYIQVLVLVPLIQGAVLTPTPTTTPLSDMTLDLGYNHEATLKKYTGSSKNVVVPKEWNGYKITEIGNEAFKNCVTITNITIPEGVHTIGNSAFSGCSNLEMISIPESVSSIGYLAFDECSKLTSIRIPNGVQAIKWKTFYKCTYLARIYLPDSVTTIEEGAFQGCSYLTSITLPNKLKTIGKDAFLDCMRLETIEIPYGVTTIGKGCFWKCGSLKSIKIPSTVSSIEKQTFIFCWDLTNVLIPDSIRSIGEEAFSYCSSLNSLTIPNSVTSIGENAFWNCDKLNLIVTKGSYAEKYCKQNKLKYKTKK